MNHRFLHGNSRGANAKFRVHFSEKGGAHPRLVDDLMNSLGLSLQNPIFSELNELYDREHGIEVVTAKDSIDMPDLPGGGRLVIEYEVKTTAIVSQEAVQLLAQQGIERALWALLIAFRRSMFGDATSNILVVDLREVQEPSTDDLIRQFFGDGQSGDDRIVM